MPDGKLALLRQLLAKGNAAAAERFDVPRQALAGGKGIPPAAEDADPAVPPANQGRHGAARGPGVVGEHAVETAAVKGPVNQDHRHAPVCGSGKIGRVFRRRDIEDAVHLLGEQKIELFPLGGRVAAAVADDGAVSLPAQDVLHPGDDGARKDIVEIGNQHPDRFGPAGGKAAGDFVDPVVQRPDGPFDFFAVLRQNVAAVEEFGYRRHREPRRPRDVPYGGRHAFTSANPGN